MDDVNLSLTELFKGEVTDVADNYIHFNGPLDFFFFKVTDVSVRGLTKVSKCEETRSSV